MVTRLLRLADGARPADAADALALAICHVWRGAAQAPAAGRGLAGGTARRVRRRPAALDEVAAR